MKPTRRTTIKCLAVIGSVLLLAGIVMAFEADKKAQEVMGIANLGVAVVAPEANSPQMEEKIRERDTADHYFNAGLFITAAGIILQTIAGVM